MPDRLTDAVVDIATQLRRLADAHTTPVAANPDAPTTTPDDDQAAVPPVPDAYRAPAGDPRAVLNRIRDARQWSDVQAQLGMYYGWTAEQSGQRARAYRLAADSLTAAAERNADEERKRAESSDEAARRAMEQRQDMATERYALQARAETAEKRLKLAHQARRAKVAQLDDIKRAMLDTGLMAEGDPYSHADLADVIRQTIPGEPQPEDTAQCWRKEPHVPHTWTLSPEEGGVDCPGVDQPAVKEQPGPDFTSPLTGIEVRDPCPHCGNQQMVARSQFAKHVARLHPEERQPDAR